MREIIIGVTGILQASNNPHEIGWYVRIEDDSANTGGFKIFSSSNSEFKGWGHVFDNWVEKKEQLSQFVEDAGWIIQWGK